MTEQEIIDNNRIIAEFMGAKPCKQHPNTQLFLTIKDNKNPSLQYWHLLKYHISWDWLIPVIDKILSSEEYFEYKKTLGIYNSGVFVNTKFIKASFDSVVEFIEWYNTNIKQ